MKLFGKAKDQVEETEIKEETSESITEESIELSDDELENVGGGASAFPARHVFL